MKDGIVAVVLAAGLSRRMAPAHKLLQKLGASTVIGTMLGQLDASVVDKLLLVVGHEAERVAAEAAPFARCRIVRAHAHEDGLSATLAAGLAQVPPDRDVLVCLADMPLVRTATINRLVGAFETALGERPIIAPVHRGRRGNPVLWHRGHLAALAHATGDEGGRALLRAEEGHLVLVETDDSVLFDIDTEDALDRARRTLCG